MKVNSIYKLSDKPNIWLGIGSKNWHLLENNSNTTAYILTHPMWFFSWSSLLHFYKQRKKLKQKNINLILLQNSKKENRFSIFFGFESLWINQNIQVCEHLFAIEKNEKKYDATYIAAAKKYKRLHLAKDIKNLNIITYFWPDIRDKDGNWDLHTFEPCIKHCTFNKQRIATPEICTQLNQSYCGLALSAKEGAMLAIMEYFYSGIPVVTTESIGGRDQFYDHRFVKVVAANSKAVKKAVELMIQSNIDPNLIRDETIKKVELERRKFYELVKKLHIKHNAEIEEYSVFTKRVWGSDTGIESLRVI